MFKDKRSIKPEKSFPCLISHSHTVITFHPNSLSLNSVSRSLFLLFDILLTQNSVLLLGVYAYLQPGCPCQKHP